MIKNEKPDVGVNSGANGVKNVNGKDYQADVMRCITEDAGISIAQIVANTGIQGGRLTGIIKKMKDAGVLQREGASRSGHWVIEYNDVGQS